MEDIHNWQSKFESCEYAERFIMVPIFWTEK